MKLMSNMEPQPIPKPRKPVDTTGDKSKTSPEGLSEERLEALIQYWNNEELSLTGLQADVELCMGKGKKFPDGTLKKFNTAREFAATQVSIFQGQLDRLHDTRTPAEKLRDLVLRHRKE